MLSADGGAFMKYEKAQALVHTFDDARFMMMSAQTIPGQTASSLGEAEGIAIDYARSQVGNGNSYNITVISSRIEGNYYVVTVKADHNNDKKDQTFYVAIAQGQ